MSRTIAFVLAVAMLALLPASAGADVEVTAQPQAAFVSAYGGVLVWSEKRGSGRYRLVQRVNGQIKDVPIRGASHDFDADLGPGPGGGVSAVYARCGKDPVSCDVWRYDFRSHRERKVKDVSEKDCGEDEPSIWRKAVAFQRFGDKDCKPGLYVGRGGKPKRLEEIAVAETDLAGRCLAVWRVESTKSGSRSVIAVLRANAGGKLDEVRSGAVNRYGEGFDVSFPVLSSGRIWWLEDLENFDPENAFVGRSRVGGRCRASAVETTPQPIDTDGGSLAVDEETIFFSNGAGVFQADPTPTFQPTG